MEVSHGTSVRKRPEIRTKWGHESYLPEDSKIKDELLCIIEIK